MKHSLHLPWQVESGAIVSAKGTLLKADRENPNTSPVERDRIVNYACQAANLHEELLAVAQKLARFDVTGGVVTLKEAIDLNRAVLAKLEGEP